MIMQIQMEDILILKFSKFVLKSEGSGQQGDSCPRAQPGGGGTNILPKN